MTVILYCTRTELLFLFCCFFFFLFTWSYLYCKILLIVHKLTDCYWLFLLKDIDSGPVHHQTPLIMLQNVRPDVRENNKWAMFAFHVIHKTNLRLDLDLLKWMCVFFSCGGPVQKQRACYRNEGYLLHVTNRSGSVFHWIYSKCILWFFFQTLLWLSIFSLQCVDALIGDFKSKPKYKAAYVYFTDCK